MENITQKIEAFALLVQTEHEARHTACGSRSEFVKQWSKTTIKPGSKFTKVDVGTSGKYMVENATGNIFGIKGYGVVHKGHFYGTVDTTSDYNWGDFYPTRKDGGLGTQSRNGCPAITHAPEPDKTSQQNSGQIYAGSHVAGSLDDNVGDN